MKNLGKTEGEIRCIPNNDEKYISFSKEIIVGKYVKNYVLLPKTYEIRFIDSFKFMSSSLSGLVENLKKSGLEKFVYLEKEFREIELLTRKGVYPYDYMDGIEKFSEQLPPQKEFYSKLNDCGISDEDYEHAQKIWKEFKIQNMGEYHDLYLKTDDLMSYAFRKNDYNTGTQLNLHNFTSLYGLIYFDLSYQKEVITRDPKQLILHYRLNVAPAANVRAHSIVFYENEVVVKTVGNELMIV